MEITDCSVVVIEAVNYCLVVIHKESWLDELNSLSMLQAAALVGSTALTWYVAWGIRTTLKLLGHSPDNED